MVKIIFLDIDGVLNNDSDDSIDLTDKAHFINPTLVTRLNNLIASTDAKVVLTSTWRLGLTLDEILDLCSIIGLEGEVIGMTDSLNQYPFIHRGNEILKWIIDNEDLVGPKHEYKSYVIIDDDNDMLYRQRNNFVKVDGELGLTEENVLDAFSILNK